METGTIDTDALVQAVRAGDLEKYGLLVREHQAAVRAFVATYCPNREQIDEVAQQTFIWAYEHLADYQTGTRFLAWLKAIARNKLLAELEVQRRESDNRSRYCEFLQATSAHEELSRDESPDESGLAEALRGCVDKLPEDLRSLLNRRYKEDVPVRTLAEKVKKTETALKVTLFRIRQMLKRCVEERHQFPVYLP
jgi:RNA polymerase sigma-70 factor, ECF subfamily